MSDAMVMAEVRRLGGNEWRVQLSSQEGSVGVGATRKLALDHFKLRTLPTYHNTPILLIVYSSLGHFDQVWHLHHGQSHRIEVTCWLHAMGIGPGGKPHASRILPPGRMLQLVEEDHTGISACTGSAGGT